MSEGDIDKISQERKWVMGCYVPIFNVVVCLLASVRMADSKFCLFHARQGLVVFALWFLTLIVGFFSSTLSLMLWGVVLLFYIVGIYAGYKRKIIIIPILGQIALKIPEYYLYQKLTGKTPEFDLDSDVEKGLEDKENRDMVDKN